MFTWMMHLTCSSSIQRLNFRTMRLAFWHSYVKVQYTVYHFFPFKPLWTDNTLYIEVQDGSKLYMYIVS